MDLKIPNAAQRGDPPPPAGGSWAQLSPETVGGDSRACPVMSQPLPPPAQSVTPKEELQGGQWGSPVTSSSSQHEALGELGGS